MNVTIKRKNGKTITYNRAYEVFGRGQHDEKFVVLYPDEFDHGVEAEMEYNTDSIDSVVITFTEKLETEKKYREACEKCAYNDEGACFCSERTSVCCPYAEEGD